MGYDDMKLHGGRGYTGAPVGLRHDWSYNGRWEEEKVSPHRWRLRYRGVKRRRTPAPVGSGAAPSSAFQWLIVGLQSVVKVDADAYRFHLEGVKYLASHRRAERDVWAHEYRNGVPLQVRVAAGIEHVLSAVRSHKGALDAISALDFPPSADFLLPTVGRTPGGQ